MNDNSGTPATEEAQRIHEQRQAEDPEHDRGGCWCCCLDCDWDHEAVVAGRLERLGEWPLDQIEAVPGETS